MVRPPQTVAMLVHHMCRNKILLLIRRVSGAAKKDLAGAFVPGLVFLFSFELFHVSFNSRFEGRLLHVTEHYEAVLQFSWILITLHHGSVA